MNLKGKIWKYATAFVVVLIILNPEMAELALFIDAIGLEMFLMLLEAQVLAIIGVFINENIKPAYAFMKHLCLKYRPIISWNFIKEESKGLILVVPGPVILMNILVVLVTIGIVLNVH